MSTTQKQAWFNLVVIALCLATMLALIPILGSRKAQGALGLLGLWGLTPFLFRKSQGAVASDERDALIHVRSLLIAYSLLWVILVGVGVGAAYSYGDKGAVPVRQLQMGIWFGAIFVIGISSISNLVQYGRGASNDT